MFLTFFFQHVLEVFIGRDKNGNPSSLGRIITTVIVLICVAMIYRIYTYVNHDYGDIYTEVIHLRDDNKTLTEKYQECQISLLRKEQTVVTLVGEVMMLRKFNLENSSPIPNNIPPPSSTQPPPPPVIIMTPSEIEKVVSDVENHPNTQPLQGTPN